ncbi:hypothetical protein vseg_005647 [Gypsophila vaccaria]
MAADWSNLPTDLLGAIAIELETIEDFISFSAVCRSWNRALSSVKHMWEGTPFPWLLLAENNVQNPDCIRKVFNPDNNKCYNLNLPSTFGARCWGSAYGWIAIVTRDLNVQLFNPITNIKLQFPSFETLPHIYRDTENVAADAEDYYLWFLRKYLDKLVVVKVSHGDHYEFIVMVVYDIYNTCKLAFARQGSQLWTPVSIEQKDKIPINDLMTTDEYVYGLYDDGTIIYWNVKEFLVPEPIIKPMDFSRRQYELFTPGLGLEKAYFVRSGRDFLMVIRSKRSVLNSNNNDYDYDIVYETVEFEVHKLNPKDKRWEETKDLGDMALFVGCNYSMAISVTTAKCLRPNCIYFTDDEADHWTIPTELGGHDMGVYDINSSEINRFYEGADTRSSVCSPIWFIPRL